MSVKIINTDARHFFSKVVERFSNHLQNSSTVGRPEEIVGLKEAIHAFREMLGSEALWTYANDNPIKLESHPDTIKSIFGRNLDGKVLFQRNVIFLVRGVYSWGEASRIVSEYVRKQRSAVEYLEMRDDARKENVYERRPIPEKIRSEVWRRDRAKCVQCGSVHNLEFDHLIPVSKGGGMTARNIQLLCEACNRSKSDHI